MWSLVISLRYICHEIMPNDHVWSRVLSHDTEPAMKKIVMRSAL